MGKEPVEHIKVFYCYAREDQILRDELEKHLTPLKRSGKIITWCDREILPGTEWESKISKELNTADIVLLLVSPDFICSDYCYGNEMKRAYERHSAGEACVISIILRPVLWKGTDVSRFQLLPAEGKPVTRWSDRDEAFENVAQGIDQVVEKLFIQKSRRQQRQTNNLERISGVKKPYRTQVLIAKDALSVPKRSQRTGQLSRTILHERYLILGVIGLGGQGAIYQAKDVKRQGALCAIKELSLSMVPPEEQALAIKNFKSEAKMLSVLSHPCLPAFTHLFAENQRYFLVMEYIDGTTLEDLLERNRGPFSERRVLMWAEQLCDVLEYLHSQKPPIIFRDMKPGNVMLTRQGHIKLIDFGIARFFHPTNTTDTQILGTPGFAPPEQYGRAPTDERSDIYALAITLFQLLTNTFSVSGFGLHAFPTSPHISPKVVYALKKAASLDPDDRYNNVAEFRRALLGRSQMTQNLRNSTIPSSINQSTRRPVVYRQQRSVTENYTPQLRVPAQKHNKGIKAMLHEYKQRVIAFFMHYIE